MYRATIKRVGTQRNKQVEILWDIRVARNERNNTKELIRNASFPKSERQLGEEIEAESHTAFGSEGWL